jgi:type IV pilus assembly protein PilP
MNIKNEVPLMFLFGRFNTYGCRLQAQWIGSFYRLFDFLYTNFKIKPYLAQIFVIGSFVLLLASCGGDDTDLNNYINRIKSRPGAPIEPIPEFKPLPKFIYPEDTKRRSPFKPVVDQQSDNFAPNIKRPKQPLEAFPLDALKFVGILKNGPIVWALISQPGGLVSRVKAGDFIGQNYGQVMLIKEKYIRLQETIQVSGKWEKKLIRINLRAPK